MRLWLITLAFGLTVSAADIVLPLDDGTLLIHAQFIRSNGFGDDVPELKLILENHTSAPWRKLQLQFEVAGQCNGEPRQWTIPVKTSLGWVKDHPVNMDYVETIIPLVGKVHGCRSENFKVSLIVAESFATRIDGVTGERVDFEKERQEIKAKRDAEAAERAEERRKADEEQAKKEEFEAVRQRRFAAEQKRKQAEADARYAKLKAEEQAKEAEERRKVRRACSEIHRNTADKKVSDLTVREEQEVRACQALGLYPPH